MRAPTATTILLLLLLVCLASLADSFLKPVPNLRLGHHNRLTVHKASASSSSFPAGLNVELLRASLRLLGTHERQKAQDWEDALVDAGRELALAKLMCSVCDTRLALLDFAEEHIRKDFGFNGHSTTVWDRYARTEEGQKWLGEFERVGIFKETPIEVLEEEGLAGVLEDAVEATEAAEAAEGGEAGEEEESWVGEAWDMAERVVKEEAEKAAGGEVEGRWTGPEE